jgi:hypothetical protein
MIEHEPEPKIQRQERRREIATVSYNTGVLTLSFHQTGNVGGTDGGFNEDVDVGGTGGDNKMGENSGGIKFAHTS